MPIRDSDDEIVAVAQVINKTNERGFTRDDEKVCKNNLESILEHAYFVEGHPYSSLNRPTLGRYLMIVESGPSILCSTQLSMKFQLLINLKCGKRNLYSDDVFILLINVKMPTIVGIFNIYEHDKLHDQLS